MITSNWGEGEGIKEFLGLALNEWDFDKGGCFLSKYIEKSRDNP